MMEEIRCGKCNRLLALASSLGDNAHLSIKCPRCKEINNKEAPDAHIKQDMSDGDVKTTLR